MSDRPERFVFDSYALIALFEDEPGGATVEAILDRASAGEAEVSLSVVNLGEAFYITLRESGAAAAESVRSRAEHLPLRLVPADLEDALAAARFKARYRMSYADGFAAALAQSLDATVVTGDPEFRALEGQIRVQWLNGGPRA